MKMIASALALASAFAASAALASPADHHLDVYWVDTEGGAATLFVTPAGESVLVDTGFPGARDAKRIAETAAKAGIKKIDHVVITHFHVDHYGGLPDLVKQIPVGIVHDHDMATAPSEPSQAKGFPDYKAAKVDGHEVVKPGQKLALKQAKGAAPISFEFLGAVEKFVAAKGKPSKAQTELCATKESRPIDDTDNKNSVVSLVSFGPFHMFVGGDITWNTETALVCPGNRVGGVDVYQTDHHGLDQSNNPVLVKTLAPTVAVMNNGAKKAGEPHSVATLKGAPSVKALFALHRNVRVGAEQNPDPTLTANADEKCQGNGVQMSVEPTGKSYTVSIPATGVSKTFETRKKG